MSLTFFKRIQILVLIFMLLAVLSVVSAQGSRVLTPGEPVVSFVTPDAPVQIYNFSVTQEGTVNLVLTADEGAVLTLAVSDDQGNVIAQDSNTEGEEITLEDVELPAQGTYYITVFAAPGQDAEINATFTLTLETDVAGDAATPEPDATEETADGTEEAPTATQEAETETETTAFQTGQVLTTDGLQVTLAWNSTADMNLQVRDPVGQTLYFDSTSTNNGGVFGFDVNGLCEVLTPENAEEVAEWTPGTIPTGSYEILVFYRQECEENGPVEFTVNVTVDGVALDPITATLTPPLNGGASVYLASFSVNNDGTAEVETQGIYADTRVLPRPASEFLAEEAQLIERGVVVRDVITTDDYYDMYDFQGTANETVNINLTAQNGNLDTLLLVFDQTGNIIADNDDILSPTNTNSEILNLLLPTTGTYSIMATRYGKDVGGTEGNYELAIDEGSAAIPQEITNLQLPQGDIEVTLVWPTNADLQLLVRDPSGEAVYDDQQTVVSGGRLNNAGNVNCAATTTTPVSYIYWPTGFVRGGAYEVEVWFQDTCNDTTPVAFTLYVEVGGGRAVQSYTARPQLGETFVTSFFIDEANNVRFGPGGIIGDSSTLDYSGETAVPIVDAQTLNGSITPENKFDVYTFEGSAGDVISLSMTGTSGSLDTSLFLIGPSGLELTSNDDAGGDTTDSLIGDYSLPESGTYTILATHYGTIYGGTVGAYSISLQITEPADEDEG